MFKAFIEDNLVLMTPTKTARRQLYAHRHKDKMPSAIHRSQTKVIVFALILIGLVHRAHQQQYDYNELVLRNPKDTRFTDFMRDNCVCTSELSCECCGGFENNMFNIHQSLCVNWVVNLQNSTMHTVVKRNALPLITNIFSIFPLPPFCLPLGPLPLTVCLQIHSISSHEQGDAADNVLHACADVKLSLLIFDLFTLPLGCLDFGGNGIMPHPNEF